MQAFAKWYGQSFLFYCGTQNGGREREKKKSRKPLISEADVDGQESRCQDDAHASDDGQSGENGNADARRFDDLNGAILGRLFIHPRDGPLLELQCVGGIVVLGHLDFV